MDRRTLLAIALMLVVAVLPTMFLRPRPSAPPVEPAGDTVAAPITTTPEALPELGLPSIREAPAPRDPTAVDVTPEVSVSVQSPLYRYTFSSRGARVVAAELLDYRSFAPGDSGPVQLLPEESRFLEYGFVVGSDTLELGDWDFRPSESAVTVRNSATTIDWVASRGGITVRLRYTFWPDSYLFDVDGQIEGVARGLVLVNLGPRLALVEADSAEDFRAYSVVRKTATKTESVPFRKLKSGEVRDLPGPFEWVAIKSKYFLGAVLVPDENQPRFGGARVVGGPRSGKHAVRADVVTSLPAPSGSFSYSVYLGPQEFRRLAQIGHDFADVNPYGWVLRPVIRPFANLIMRILLWMHETLSLGYGWVLILFGLAVRALLWPLNQKAMRSSIAMQAVQPDLKAIQERYKQDPQRLQQETMKLYKEHGVNPLGGCLPMLLPMPVLFALFFVFRETIELRGVPFLWLPDLSRHDPLYIIPVLMGLSMFVLTRLGQMGIPPNPQAKMMLYVMPGFMTFIFLRFSSGLNLYYAVSNIASLPQQWLIARERVKKGGVIKKE